MLHWPRQSHSTLSICEHAKSAFPLGARFRKFGGNVQSFPCRARLHGVAMWLVAAALRLGALTATKPVVLREMDKCDKHRHGKSNADGIKRCLYELARKSDLEKSWPRKCSFGTDDGVKCKTRRNPVVDRTVLHHVRVGL
jgi:hypothetical protein